MKVALLADNHIGVRKGNDKFLAYFDKFYTDVFFPELDQRGITNVIIAGDLFDDRISNSTHVFDECARMLLIPLEERGIKTHVIIGNHDTRYKSTNRVNTPRVVLGLDSEKGRSYPNVSLIEDDVETINFGGVAIDLVPWITSENQERIYSAISKSRSPIAIGHFEIAGAKLDRVQTSKHGMDVGILKQYHHVFSGHFHHKSKYGNVQYLGAPYEMTWIDCDDPKGFHIFDTDTFELEFVRNPCTMFNKVVFDGSEKAKDEIRKYGSSYVRVIVEDEGNNHLNLNKLVSELEDIAHEVKIIENPRLIAPTKEEAETIEVTIDDTLTILEEYISSQVEDAAIADLAKSVCRELYRSVIVV